MNFYVVMFLCTLLKESVFEEVDETFSKAVIHLLKKDDIGYICFGAFFTKDKVMTTCKCLGRYGVPEVKKKVEWHFYTAFDPKLLYGIRRDDGKRFDGVQSNVYELCAPSLIDPLLYLHDLAVLKLTPEVESYLQVSVAPPSFEFCIYAKTKRDHETIDQVIISELKPSTFRTKPCKRGTLSNEDCVKEIQYLFNNEGFGIAYSDSSHLNDYGSPIVCKGTIIGVISKLQRPDIFFVDLNYTPHYDFIRRAMS